MGYFTGVDCDKCGCTIAWGTVWAKKWLKEWARKAGWTIGKKCLCPKCKVQKKQ
jgi:hypothetical protein